MSLCVHTNNSISTKFQSLFRMTVAKSSQHFIKNDNHFCCGFCGLKYREELFYHHVKQHHHVKPNSPYCEIEDVDNSDCSMKSESDLSETDEPVTDTQQPYLVDAEIDLPKLDVQNGLNEIILDSGHKGENDENIAQVVDSESVLEQKVNCSDTPPSSNSDTQRDKISAQLHESQSISVTSDALSCKGKLLIIPIMRFNEGMLAINPCFSTNKVIVPSNYCDFCNITFRTINEFNSHIRCHGQTFQSIKEFDCSRLYSYTTTRQRDRAQFLFKCCVCPFSSRLKRAIRKHILSFHLMRNSL